MKYVQKLLFSSMIALLSACGGGGSGGDDTPGVASVNPPNGASNVVKTTVITATFSDGMDETDLATNIQAEFTLGDSNGNTVSGTAAYDEVNNVASFNPAMDLGVLKTYTATLGTGITHSGGTAISQYNWSFTTAEGTWTSGAKVDIDTSVVASDPHIARGGDGEVMAVWVTSDGFIYGRKYSSGAWGSINQIYYTTYPVSDLRVAMDNNGNAMAVWSEDGPGGNDELLAKYYNGTSWDVSETPINNSTLPSDTQLAFDASGNAIAVWKENNDIRANRYNVGLMSPAWEGEQLIETSGEAANNPHLAILDNGDAIAVWAQNDVIAGYNVIFSNYYTANTGWDVSPTSVGNSATGSVPQVAVDSTGNAIAVWLQGTAPVSVWAANYDGGTSNWASLTELENDAHIATKPQVGVDAQGNAIAIWRGVPTTGADRLRSKFFDGSSWVTLGNIDDGIADSLEPKLAMDSEGHAIVVWRQNDAMDRSSAWGNRYRSNTGWVGPQLLETDETWAINALTLEVVIDSNGNAAAVWIQSDDIEGIDSMWAARFD